MSLVMLQNQHSLFLYFLPGLFKELSPLFSYRSSTLFFSHTFTPQNIVCLVSSQNQLSSILFFFSHHNIISLVWLQSHHSSIFTRSRCNKIVSLAWLLKQHFSILIIKHHTIVGLVLVIKRHSSFPYVLLFALLSKKKKVFFFFSLLCFGRWKFAYILCS